MRYDVYYTTGNLAGHLLFRGIDVGQTARAMALDEHDIKWAIEECGRCDGLLFLPGAVRSPPEIVAVETGDAYPGPSDLCPEGQADLRKFRRIANGSGQ